MMKREEIEQLLVDYTHGEISPEDRKLLEELFVQDTALKQEADEMAAVWLSLNAIEERSQPSAAMDKQFYALLQNAKADEPLKDARVVSISSTWLKAVAAIAACLAMFVIGRYTVAPVQVVKYKTVVIKQPAINAPVINKPAPMLAIVHPINKTNKPLKEKNADDNNSELARQLRSVYASERIGAVMKITGKPNLNDADLKSLELALKEDPNANVRLTILNALRPMANKQNVQQVLTRALNQQDNISVQTSIIDMLVDSKSIHAIPQMVTLLENKNTSVIVQDKIKEELKQFTY